MSSRKPVLSNALLNQSELITTRQKYTSDGALPRRAALIIPAASFAPLQAQS